MENAGEAQDGTATPVAASVTGAASAPPLPRLCLSCSAAGALAISCWYLCTDSLIYFLVLPELALKAHVEMLEQPF